MEYRLLGKSSLNISRIGFGCMSLDASAPASEKILQQALYLGINYFDTADMYQRGLNEELVGKAFSGLRDKVILASKAGNQWRPDGSGWDWNPTKKYILAAVEKSLQRLKTDYIDLYQLHGGTLDDPMDETIEAFELLKKQGKILHYGISSIRPNVIREYVKRSAIVSVMMQYSLLDRRPEESCFDLLKSKNIGVLARGSLAKGLLVNKPAEPYLNYTSMEVLHAATAIASLTTDNRRPAQTAIRYVLKQEPVAAAIVGIRTMEQLEDAVRAIDSPGLQKNEIKLLQQVLPINKYDLHR